MGAGELELRGRRRPDLLPLVLLLPRVLVRRLVALLQFHINVLPLSLKPDWPMRLN
jgi:hypothetical protein